MTDKTTSNIPKAVHDVMVNLRVIAGIQINQKLNCLNGTYGDADSICEGVKRWWTGESRNDTISFINFQIDDAIKVCRTYPEWSNNMADDIEKMSDALTNLEQTYRRKKDEITVSRISTIKIRIDRERFLRACNPEYPLSGSLAHSKEVPTGILPIQSDAVSSKRSPRNKGE